MSQERVEVSEYVEHDLERHAAFQREAFRNPFALIDPAPTQTAAYYDWKYRPPTGVARIARALVGPSLAATATAVPMRFRYQRDALVVHHIVDLAAAPSFRGQGYFSRALAALLASLPPDAPAYCFPNRRSAPLLVRAGFRQAALMRLRLAPISPAVEVWNETPPSCSLDVLDPAVLAWRFQRRPGVDNLTAIDGPSHAIAARRILWRGAAALVVLAVRGRLPLGHLPRLPGPTPRIGLWLGDHDVGFSKGSFEIPPLLLPRTFPAYVRNWPDGAEARFSAAEWDVL